MAWGVLVGAIALPLSPFPSLAQIVPDSTLGSEGSQVTPSNNIRGLPGILIQGGARRGANLFQSFQDFNVGEGQRVYFANPAGIESILSRVTGRNPSNILGTLGVNGSANLFFLNPNGILFGPNARLDIAGSFVASTSDRWEFGNGQTYNATNPNAPPLLTVTLRPGLPYGTNYQGPISQAGNLAVGTGQTLSLQGNSVTQTGSLTAPEGTVQLLGDRISLLDHARIDVSGIGGGGTVLIGGDYQGKGIVPNASETFIGPKVQILADGTSNTTTANGGRVIVWANGNTSFFGTISAKGGPSGGDGGFVEVSGKQTLDFKGQVDTTAPKGKIGDLLLDPYDLEIDEPIISTSSVTFLADNNITFNAPVRTTGFGSGITATAGNSIFVNDNLFTNGGPIRLVAGTGNISVRDAFINTSPDQGLTGFAGDVRITAGNAVEIIRSEIDARSLTTSRGDFTTIRISGKSVLLDQVYISATNSQDGYAGDIAITAREQVLIRNSRGPRTFSQGVATYSKPGIFSQGYLGQILIGKSNYFDYSPDDVTIEDSQLITNNIGTGNGQTNAGDIRIRSNKSITVLGSIISSSTNRAGDAGTIILRAPGSIFIAGQSEINSDAYGAATGNAGGVGIVAGSFYMAESSSISTSTYTRSSASNLNRFSDAPTDVGSSAGSVVILVSRDAEIDRSTIFNNLEHGASGQAGFVLFTARNLTLLNGAQIQTIVRGNQDGRPPANGDAGNILIGVDKTLKIIGTNGQFSSALFSSVGEQANGKGGFIWVEARSIHVRNQGRIDANNVGSGPAGDILISARGVWVDNKAFITASSRSGEGGNILLDVPGAIILGRGGNISTSTDKSAPFPVPFQRGAGNIAIGSGRWVNSETSFFAPAFLGRTLLVAGKTPRDSNIFSVGVESAGGNIRINAFRLQNIAQRIPTLTTNDISAISGIGLDGTVVINSLNVFPSLRVDPLPDRPEPPNITEGCDPRVRQETSRFTRSGRGGLPANAAEGLNQETFAEPSPEVTPSTSPAPTNPPSSAPEDSKPQSSQPSEGLTPARGWIRDGNGKIRFTAYATDPNLVLPPNPLWYNHFTPCKEP
jgi:filamentous hemagglutinin family protein